MDCYKVLSKYFGYKHFKNGQEPLVEAILSGRDALAVMPTGGGKSICYQIPALMLPGLTIVISPLISLMKDQVMQLCENGIPAAYLNSSLSAEQSRRVYRNLVADKYKLLYVAPERLEMPEFIETCMNIDISLVAVDEAHCISEWGNDFRPGYLRISDFLNVLPKRPVVAAFTATATEKVRRDIKEKLQLQNPHSVVTGFDRPNLYFKVEVPKNKKRTLLEMISERKDKCGIIYCQSRKNVEKICELLRDNGFDATRYHAGLTPEERQENQDDFIYDRKTVMVATNAFGMGINKSNVGYVIHYNMPTSIESYYQEAGRAGRDGSDAECILLYSPSDIILAKLLIESGENADVDTRKQDYIRLEKMIAYCKATKCLRGILLDYFGQVNIGNCGNCGNCHTVFEGRDITVEAQKILSCIKRIENKLGYNVGLVLVVRTLMGSREKRVLELGLDTLSTYGIMSDYGKSDIGDIITYLIDNAYINKDEKFGGLSLMAEADKVLFGRETVMMVSRKVTKAPKAKKSVSELSPDEILYDRLRKLRSGIAKEQGVPAFMIFSNTTLTDMAKKKPTTLDGFLDVSGVGNVKASRYGERFVKVIRAYMSEKY
ncbi:MAG: DNA helicase RecQ [Ruminococcaceae bacterium]|nr:DNA helicase RecQ [Oscillospiraceae bacterium]